MLNVRVRKGLGRTSRQVGSIGGGGIQKGMVIWGRDLGVYIRGIMRYDCSPISLMECPQIVKEPTKLYSLKKMGGK